MNLISALPLMMAGIALGVSWQYLMIYWQDPSRGGYREFAIFSILFSGYAFLCSGLYMSGSLQESLIFQQYQFIVLALVFPVYLRFSLVFLGEPRGWFEKAVMVVMVLCALVGVFNPAGVLIDPTQPVETFLSIPGVTSLVCHEAKPGSLADFISIFTLIVSLYLLRITVIQYRKGSRRAGALLVALLIMFAAGLNDTLVIHLGVSFYLLEYAYFAMIVLMSGQLAESVRQAVRVRKDLQLSEERYQILFNAIPEAIFIHDSSDGSVLQVNARFEEYYGFPADRIREWTPEMGSSNKPGFTPADVMEKFRLAITEGPQQFDWHARRADGSEFWIEVHLLSTMINGKPRVIASVRDISLRKTQEKELEEYRLRLETMVNQRTEELQETLGKLKTEADNRERAVAALARSEERYRHLIENLMDDYFFYVHNLDGVFTYVSPSIRNVLGYTQEEFYTHFSEYLTDDPVNQSVEEHTAQSILGIKQTAYEVDIRHRNGERRRLEVTEFPVKDSAGNVTAVEGIARDITRELESREQLRHSEERFRGIVQSASVGMHLWKLDEEDQLILEGYNPEADRILGIDHSRMVGKPMAELFPPLMLTSLPDQYRRICREGETYAEQQFQYDDNLVAGVYEVRAFQTQPLHMVAMFHDVTEQYRSERILQTRRAGDDFIARMTSLFLHMGEIDFDQLLDQAVRDIGQHLDVQRCSFSVIKTGGIYFENSWSLPFLQPGLDHFPMDAEAIKTFISMVSDKPVIRVQPGEMALMPPVMQEHCRMVQADSVLAVSLQEEESNYLLLSVDRGPGGRRWTDEEVTILRAMAAVMQTARQRHQVMQELRESEHKFRAVFDNAGGAIFLADTETGLIIDCNEVAVQLLGRKRSEIIGMHQRELHPSDDEDKYREIFSEHATVTERVEIDAEVVNSLGEQIPVWIHTQPLKLGNRHLLVGLFINITERRAAEQALLEAHGALSSKAAELEEVNEDLEQYAYVVSHDLKAPLRAIHNYAEFLQEDLGAMLQDEQIVYLENMFKAIRQGEKLVEDLLQYSRLDGVDVSPQAIKLDRFFREIVELLPSAAGAEVTIPQSGPTVFHDRTLLLQVFQNLMDNALKFNRSEFRKVIIRWELQIDGYVTVDVEDNGIGVDQRYQEQIFGIFEQLHARNEFPGTGIGLAIVRKALRRLDGDIEILPGVDGGSCFKVTLPVTLSRIE